MLARRGGWGEREKGILPRAPGTSVNIRQGAARVAEIHERLLIARWSALWLTGLFCRQREGRGGGGTRVCLPLARSQDNATINIFVGVSIPKISMNNRDQQAGLLRNRLSRC